MRDGHSGYAVAIADFLRSVVWADDRVITDNTDLLAEGHLDSVGIMQLVLFFEEQWQIRIESDQVSPRHFRTVAAMSKLLAIQSGA
jgi:acyl carrier protein